jgi:excinuclease ABC subunit A
MILSSDYVIDLGPFAGRHGGEICCSGDPGEIMKGDSLTALYLNKTLQIPVPPVRREGNGHQLVLRGAKGNNLKNIDLALHLVNDLYNRCFR